MDIIYYKDPEGNFGDDLNAVLWPAILSKDVLASDRVRLLGIGSIFNTKTLQGAGPSKAPIFILGTGSSYGHPPKNTAGLIVNAVRGPFTARVVGHPEAAVTDGAILMAAAAGFLPATRSATKIVFIPHHKSLWRGHWQAAAEAAGMTFINPQWTVEQVLAAMADAKLVVTEAMHGAIFADTMRIPWVPVVASPRIDAFKWRDWTLSMELPYKPVFIPPSTPAEAHEVRALRALFDARTKAGPALRDDASGEELAAYLLARNPEKGGGGGEKGSLQGLRAAAMVASRLAAPFTHVPAAAKALSAAAAGSSYLSADAVFAARLARMQDGVRALEKLA